MGDHSRKSGERRQMVPNKSISFSHLALIVILVIVNAFTTYASPLEPYKRGRSASSSLIPFPRVGRRSDPLWQKSVPRAMEGDSERFVYPREFETLQLIQSLLRELQNDK